MGGVSQLACSSPSVMEADEQDLDQSPAQFASAAMAAQMSMGVVRS